MKNYKEYPEFFSKLFTEIPLNELLFNYYSKQNAPGERMRKMHSHDAIEIEYVVEGGSFIHFEDDVVRILRGNCIVIQSGIPHMFRIDHKNCRRINIQFKQQYIEGSEFDRVTKKLFSKSGYIKIVDNATIGECMNNILNEISNPKWGSELLIKAEISCLLIFLTRFMNENEAGAHPKGTQYVRDAVAFIEENRQENLKPRDVADHLYISEGYLMHMFKRETGSTLVKYITDQKISFCKQKLINTNESIAEISTSVGIYNLQYFSSLFKKHTGLSPLNFRKISREVIYKEIDTTAT